VQSALGDAAVSAGGLFNPKAVAKLHEKCSRQPASGFRDNAAFVGILSTQLWLTTFTGTGICNAKAA
ncbi:asparagine synthetase B, partial [Mesorhizobium sp. M7A.F.Ca.US.001.02.1.1]